MNELMAFLEDRMPNPDKCPQDIRESLERYVKQGIPVGGFLYAVLANDLKEAIGRADTDNLAALPHIVSYCYNNIPSASWGSEGRVECWLREMKGEA